MLLNGNTLTSLEIYQNQTDHSSKGSLFWTVDKTQTRFGQRLLRKWVGRPLLDISRLEERLNAVEELLNGVHTPKVDKLTCLLRGIKSDLERSLLRIYYGKCSRPELLIVLQTLQRISTEYAAIKSDAGFKSALINEAIATLPLINDTIISFLDRINAEAAKTDDKYAFFREEHETELIGDHKLGIAAVEQELDDHRKEAAQILKKSKPINYTTCSGIEYLVEIQNSDLKNVPASWAKISGTKKLSRFHTPTVVKMLRERDQHKESLSSACDVAFQAFLTEISSHYTLLRDSISSLATLDCLLSLAIVAALPGYTKPTFLTSSETIINITDGRHPMIEQLLPSAYIPNSTSLSTAPQHPRALLITGPNAGGKSSYVRQTALLCLLAQIGSFIPAEALEITPLTSIQTRMGAYDSLFTAQSTFQTELSETSTILKSLSLAPSAYSSSSQNSSTIPPPSVPASRNKNLLILDELGRGTSTHDGTAIASAVLEYIVRDTTSSLCLFITHYQSLASVARGFPNGELQNVHMSFSSSHPIHNSEGGSSGDEMEVESGENDADEEITFLYTLAPGVSHRSYGLNVARLARVPKPVLHTAAMKSRELEHDVRSKKLAALSKMMDLVLSEQTSENGKGLDTLIAGMEQL